jgi:DNA repair protein RadC
MNEPASMTYEIISKRKKNNVGPIMNPEDAYHLLKPYQNANQEQCIVITLNGAHEPITVSLVSIGLVNKTLIHAREVFIRAIEDRASAIIIAHNHPSGILKPSNEDNDITKIIRDAGKLIGIPAIDHIIFSKDGFISLKKEGYFKQKEET